MQTQLKQDNQWFDELYKNSYSKVSRIVYGFKFRDAAAEDLIQEIFLQAWKSYSNLRNPEAIGSWLGTIAKNKCILELKRRRFHVAIDSEDGWLDESTEAVKLVAQDEGISLDYERSVGLVADVVKSHSHEPQATIAKQFYLESRPVREIAIDLDIKQNTVLSHLRRFRINATETLPRLAQQQGVELVVSR